MEWLQTIVASMIGGLIAVGGAFALEWMRWRRQDQVQYRDQLRDLYARLFLLLTDAQAAFGHIGAFDPAHGDGEYYRHARAESWKKIGYFTTALDELDHEVEAIAPSPTRDRFRDLSNRAAIIAIDAEVAPTRADNPYQHSAHAMYSMIAELRVQMRRDLGHRERSRRDGDSDHPSHRWWMRW